MNSKFDWHFVDPNVVPTVAETSVGPDVIGDDPRGFMWRASVTYNT